MKTKHLLSLVCLGVLSFASQSFADPDFNVALRRAKYLLNGSMPNDADFASGAGSRENYRTAVRKMIEDPAFYDASLRYHQRTFGIGLAADYMKELRSDEIDGHSQKFASIRCGRDNEGQGRFRCLWSSSGEKEEKASCPSAQEQAAKAFWYQGLTAWVCPSIITTCGSDLSRCFIESRDENLAVSSELGITESFDSKFAVLRSLSKQSAGIGAGIAFENYPYTRILEPGVTALDGAIAHFYKQDRQFKIDKLSIQDDAVAMAKGANFTDGRFQLLKASGDHSETAGVISSFGWLRRYEKNRTRANQLYERLLCRKFTSELPRIFPADAGNLRTREGCKGCHATLDPLADFYKVWGEGGAVYDGHGQGVETSFNGQNGMSLADLADIIRNDKSFATCQTQHIWQWLMGRSFYKDEESLQSALTDYFIHTNYSFRELVYAIATHPAFTEKARSDAAVTDPIAQPVLGETPNDENHPSCTGTKSYATDIAPMAQKYCTNCHSDSNKSRQALTSLGQWQTLGSQSVGMMGAGQMPPGQINPEVQTFREKLRCWLENPQP